MMTQSIEFNSYIHTPYIQNIHKTLTIIQPKTRFFYTSIKSNSNLYFDKTVYRNQEVGRKKTLFCNWQFLFVLLLLPRIVSAR